MIHGLVGLRWRLGCLLAVLVSCAWWLAPAPLRGDEWDESAPLRFRRIYIPEHRIQNAPLDSGRLVPIEPSKFEDLIDSLDDAPTPGETPVAARIESAHYDAALQHGTLRGVARLDIAHEGERGTWLPLEPCNLAVNEVRWESADEQPFVLGLNAEQRLGAIVPASGELLLSWSLRGRRDTTGTTRFTLELPRSTIGSLSLQLPSNLTPVVNRGIVSTLPQEDEAADTRRWRIDFGGQSRLTLNLMPAEASGEHPQLALVRQSATYDLSPRGVEVSVQLELDVHYEPLTRIELELDPGLRLAAARYADSQLVWTTDSETDPTAASRVTVELPEPILGTGRIVRLTALAGLEMGQRWQLPGIRPAGLFWQEGLVTLRVQSPLSVERLWPSLCRQSAVEPLPDPFDGEAIEFQFYDAAASVDLVVARRESRPEMASGTSIELTATDMTALLLANVKLAKGEQFLLTADVDDQWLIDSVETVPASAMGDWTVESEGGAGRVLRVRLAEALSPEQPLQLRLGARWLGSPLDTRLTARDFELLRFRDVQMTRRLVAARSTGSHRLRVAADESVVRLDPRDLSVSDLLLFPESPRDLVFEFDHAASLAVFLESQTPRFTADLRVEATASRDSLTEVVTVRCQPDATRIDQFLLQFSQPRDVPLRWALGADERDGIDARQLSADELAQAGFQPEDEVWRIRLSRPRSLPFEVRATRAIPLADAHAVSLVSAPEAVSQRGIVVIHAVDNVPLAIANQRLRPIPPEPQLDRQYLSVRATYRYNPGQEIDTPADAALRIERQDDGPAAPAAVVWSAGLDSRYDEAGRGHHVASYRLQNSGIDRLLLQLPGDVELRGVWVDGQPNPRRVDQSSVLRVDLPPGRKFPTVEVQLATQEAWGRSGALRSVLPEPTEHVPLLSRQWQVWLPPDFELRTSDPAWQSIDADSPHLAQRVFGPLARNDGDETFLPWRGEDWARLVDETSDLRPRLAEAEGLLDRLGNTYSAMPASELTWGDLLSRQMTWAKQSNLTLLIDAEALARSNVTPRTAVSVPSAASARQRGLSLLAQADLSLWIHPDGIVLSSALATAAARDALIPVDHATLWAVVSGRLRDELRDAGLGESTRFVNATAWRNGIVAPWQQTAVRTDHQAASIAWRYYRYHGTGHLPVQVAVGRTESTQVFAWIVFLAVLSWGWWRTKGRGVYPFAALIGASLAALLVPGFWAPVASAMVLGLLAAAVIALVVQPRPSASDDLASVSTATGPLPAPASVLLLALLTILAFALPGHGAEADVQRDPSRGATYNVYIPIDEQRQPTGGYYLVPDELDLALRRQADEVRRAPQDWLLTRARYRGSLEWDLTQRRLSITEWRVVFDVQAYAGARRIRIPLDSEGISLLPDAARLDGRTVGVEWEEGGQALLCDLPEPGAYQLELRFQPSLETSNGSTGLSLGVPPVADSRLELRLPMNCPAIDVASSLGPVTLGDDYQSLQAELGPTDRLTVSWRDRGGPQGPGTEIKVDELLWLQVQPGSVVLHARFIYDVAPEGVRHLQLTADPRLRLLPPSASQLPIEEVRTLSGNPQTIQIDLARPMSGRFVVDASFLLTGASGIGNLRLPRLEVAGAHSNRRQLAVWIDPALQFEVTQPESMQGLDTTEFLGAWGPSERKPLAAYRLPPGDVRWSVATRPSEAEKSVAELITYGFERDRVEIRFEANLTATPGHTFHHELLAPAELQIESISVQEERIERATRWSRDENGRITIFLAGPQNRPQDLVLHGWLPIPFGQTELPRLAVAGTTRRGTAVRLFRRPGVLVRMLEREGLIESSGTVAREQESELGRLVAQLQTEDGADGYRLSLDVAPNDPRVRAVQVTSLYEETTGWEAEVDCRVHVSGGVLDALRFSIPSQWTGPYEVEPPASVESVAVPGQPNRQLVIRPQSAIDDSYRVRIRAPLPDEHSPRHSVPRIELLNVASLEHYLVLPTHSNLEQVGWRTRGLQAVELPSEVSLPPVAPESFAAYLVVADTFEATMRTAERATGLPQVHLADVAVTWHADGNYHAVATFDLVPAGLRNCPLWLPSGSRLVHAAVDGVPALVRGAGEGRLQLNLGPDHLPQRIEVVYRGRVEADGDASELRAPALGELPVERTLWTITGPAQAGSIETDEQTTAISPLRQELLRLENAAALIDLGAGLVVDDSRDELARWHHAWARRLLAARGNIQRLLAMRPANAVDAVRNEAETILQEQQRLARRLNTSELFADFDRQPLIASQVSELGPAITESAGPRLHCMFPGGKSTLRVHLTAAESGRSLVDWLRIAGLLVVGSALVVGTWRGHLQKWVARWPHLAVTIVGLGWWLWLTPSTVGLLIAGIAVLLAVRTS